MEERVNLSHVRAVLDDLDYPVERDDAATRLRAVTLTYAGGEGNLGDIVSETGDDEFESATDLEEAVYNVLPRDAVGEPYQSEGEG